MILTHTLKQELLQIGNIQERTDVIVRAVLQADESAECYAAEMEIVFQLAAGNRQKDVAEAFQKAGENNEIIANYNKENEKIFARALQNLPYFPKKRAEFGL